MSAAARSDNVARISNLAEEYLAENERDQILTLADEGGTSLYVDYRDLFVSDADLAEDYLTEPSLVRDAFEEALPRVDIPAEWEPENVDVRLIDESEMIDRMDVTELTSENLGEMVAVGGQLSKVTGVRPRFSELRFNCLRCGTSTYRDQTRHEIKEPVGCTGCENNGPYTPVLSGSTTIDQRKLKLETPPENRVQIGGESVTVYVERDLCHHGGPNGLADRAGERVVILGEYTANEAEIKPGNDPEVEGYIVADSVMFVEETLADINVEETREEIERLASGEEGDPVDLLRDSIAPRLEQTEQIRTVLEAGVAWLFNAYRIEPPDGDQIRGDLHMAVIGDPSTAKSTVLSNLNQIAPKSEYRSGAAISKVGLTAAAQQEEFAGRTEWTLEPGILPRANGGHCLIDEVDEVLDERSKAIHDALEGEQMVKVDKAGISADLPTRTAVCISGNPKEGRFDRYANVAEQLGMDPALISRMDILLPVEDEHEEEKDGRIADSILVGYKELSEAEVARRKGEEPPEREGTKRPVPVHIFRDWVHLARETCFPTLTDEAMGMLRGIYLDARGLNGRDDKPIPTTPRMLEAGIRLATAFARVELSDTVEPRHVERAEPILKVTISMGFDPDSGMFDSDSVGKGTPKSQKGRNEAIVALVEDHQDHEDYYDGIPEDELVEWMVDEGFDEGQTRHSIEKLRQKGELYSPGMDGRYRH